MEKKPVILIVIRLALVMLWVPVAVDKLWNLAEFHSTLLRQPFPDGWADILFWLLPLLELLAAVLIACPHHEKPRVNPFPTSRDFASLNMPSVGQRMAARSGTVASTHPTPHVTSTVGQRRPARSGEAASAHPNPRVSSTAGQRRIARGGAVASPILRLGLALSIFLMLAFTLFILFGVLGWYDKRPCGCGSVISGLTWEQHLWFNMGFLLLSTLGFWLIWSGGSSGKNPSPNGLSSRRQEGSPYNAFPNHTSSKIFCKIRFPRKFALFRRRTVCAPTLPLARF